VKAQVSEVKGVMMENIEKVLYFIIWKNKHYLHYNEKDGTPQTLLLIPYYYFDVQVLDRGEKIELLVDKTENLRSQVMDSFMMSTLAHLILHVCRSNKANMNSLYL
jgi:vesicle-associated membrane protein 72